MSVNDDVEMIYEKINQMLASKNYTELDNIMLMRDELFGKIADAIKKQLRRIKQGDAKGSTRSSILYLDLLNETKTMVLQGRNIIKSQKYFITNWDKE